MSTNVNPQILWASTDMIRHEEGSVSMPGVTEEIERHARVRMNYQDLRGRESASRTAGHADSDTSSAEPDHRQSMTPPSRRRAK